MNIKKTNLLQMNEEIKLFWIFWRRSNLYWLCENVIFNKITVISLWFSAVLVSFTESNWKPNTIQVYHIIDNPSVNYFQNRLYFSLLKNRIRLRYCGYTETEYLFFMFVIFNWPCKRRNLNKICVEAQLEQQKWESSICHDYCYDHIWI